MSEVYLYIYTSIRIRFEVVCFGTRHVPATTQLHNNLIKWWHIKFHWGWGGGVTMFSIWHLYFFTIRLNCLLNSVVFFSMVLFPRHWWHLDLRVVSSYFKAACWQHCQIRNCDRWCLSGYAFQTPKSTPEKCRMLYFYLSSTCLYTAAAAFSIDGDIKGRSLCLYCMHQHNNMQACLWSWQRVWRLYMKILPVKKKEHVGSHQTLKKDTILQLLPHTPEYFRPL